LKALVTGGAGFLGSHLVKRLVEKNYEVEIIDNLKSPSGFYFHRQEQPVLQHGRVTLSRISILGKQNDLFRNSIKQSDVVYHLAVRCLGEGLKNPDVMMFVNDVGTYLICKVCTEEQKKLVYASSCEVYGKQDRFPINEDAPLNPTTAYAASKACGEMWCRAFGETYGLDYVIVRPFNLIGPYVRTDGYAPVYIKFVKSLVKGEPLIIFGDGEQTRDFIDVNDAADGIVLASERSREVFNIAKGEEVSINNLADLIIRICYNNFLISKHQADTALTSIVHEKEREGDVKRLWADTRRAERRLIFRAKRRLEESIREVASWYEDSFK